MIIAGHIQGQRHISQLIRNCQLDVLSVVDSLALGITAAPAVGPVAVGGELELIGSSCGDLRIGDLVDVVRDLGHSVDRSSGIPGCAIEPSAGAVAHGIHGGDVQAGLLAYIRTGDGDGLGVGVKSHGHIAGSRDHEGVVIASIAPGVVPGAVGDLQVISTSGHIGVGLCVGAVTLVGHGIVCIVLAPVRAAKAAVASHVIGGRNCRLFGLLRLLRFSGAGGISRPGAAAAIPGTVGNGVAVGPIRGNGQVSGLVPLVIPVVVRRAGIHSAEDHRRVTLGHNALVITVAVGVGHIRPGAGAVVPVIDCETGAIGKPVAVRLQIQRCSLRRVGRRQSHGEQCDDHAQRQKQTQHPSHLPFCLHSQHPFQSFSRKRYRKRYQFCVMIGYHVFPFVTSWNTRRKTARVFVLLDGKHREALFSLPKQCEKRQPSAGRLPFSGFTQK